ncbi:hypothetical protein PACILC2_27610 [Paenibacillus cisolokensis]|jgi:ABC-type sugar transport system, periplasmic component|uniref:ABC transporter substrate-binding protein n=1 Tax=Paenibacillus cisolokensis TaxID=1658519 RepID=A0ABQ4N7H3_9BACL|nr:extracellular solute-binding protein [Paenibacillus cisolokensis]GIQ64193.1 hypothetical protein PACILC2_27610 [Paenibacillus cisolokensis]
MAKKQLVFALLAAGALASFMLAGCGSGNETGGAEGSGEGGANQASAPVTINMTLPGTGLPTPDNDDIKKALDEKLGTDIQLTAIQSGDDYNNQLRVRMSAGNYPDLFTTSYTYLKEFAEKGLILDLTPYLEKELKPAKDFITNLSSEDIWKKVTVNGKIYAIPRVPDVPFSSFWIRQDWLDNLKLNPPTTLDELFEVAKAFTEQDPDGNKKNDTYGITGQKFDAFSPVFGAYGVGQPGTFYEKDGNVINAYYDPNMPEALAFIKKLIDAGVVDPELMTNKGTVDQQKAFQGKAGIIFKGWIEISKDEFVNQYKTINPKAEWVHIDAPKGPAGQFNGSFDFDMPSRYYAIPKAMEKDKAKLQKIFDLINYVSGEEGNDLVMYGIEGKHYNVVDGKVEPTELMAVEGNYFHLYQITGRPNKEYLEVKFPNQAEDIEFAIRIPRIKTLDSSIVPPTGFNKADADRYAEEELVKFVYGKRPLSEYGDFLKTLETTFKYNLYVDEAMKQIKEQGLANNG